jgi:hypothetical protein
MSKFASYYFAKVSIIPVFKWQVINPLTELLLLSYLMLVTTLVIELGTF